MTELEFIKRVLKAFEFDQNDLLIWHMDGDKVIFSAQVSDQFMWGSADAEYITEENLPILEQAYADLAAIDKWNLSDLPVLFTARVRNMRPQGAAMKYIDPEQRALFEVFPERPKNLWNPKGWPE